MSLWDEAITTLEYYAYSLNSAALEDLTPFIMYPRVMPVMTEKQAARFWDVYSHLSFELEDTFFLGDTIFNAREQTLDFSEVFSNWSIRLLLCHKIPWIEHRGFFQFIQDWQDLDIDPWLDKGSYQQFLLEMLCAHPSMLLYIYEHNPLYSSAIACQPSWDSLPCMMWPAFLDFAVKYYLRGHNAIVYRGVTFSRYASYKFDEAHQRQRDFLEYKWDTYHSVPDSVKNKVLDQFKLWETISPEMLSLSGDEKASIFPFDFEHQPESATFSEFEIN